MKGRENHLQQESNDSTPANGKVGFPSPAVRWHEAGEDILPGNSVRNSGPPAPALQAHTIQRTITIEDIDYPGNESIREFRRKVMLKLKEYNFKELGSKKMWRQLDVWLENGDNNFNDWEALFSQLWDKGLLMRNERAGSMGPKNLGKRPAFDKATTDEVEIEDGQHRRHIISSSTLGLGIEKGYELLKEAEGDHDNRLEILNGWLGRNGMDGAFTSEHRALQAIWHVAHNCIGNLWPGDGNYNSTIGFIRPYFKNLLKALDGWDDVGMDALMVELDKIKANMKKLEKEWNEIVGLLKDAVKSTNPLVNTLSLDLADMHWTDEIQAIEDGWGSRPLYKALEKSMGRNDEVRLNTMLENLDVILDDRKLRDNRKYKPIFRKWLITYAKPSKRVPKLVAKGLIEDWLMNCDLDYPFGELSGDGDQKQEYSEQLFPVYEKICEPDAALFNADGPLDAFMKLNYRNF